jgi:hypothetical protein
MQRDMQSATVDRTAGVQSSARVTAVPADPAAARQPIWRRVTELADLAEIFDPDPQVCVWQRDTIPDVSAYLSELDHTGRLQAMETLKADERPRLARLPAGPGQVSGRDALIDDIAFLKEILCELLGCPAVGLRIARLTHAMCPGWHIDRVGLRLICTYRGPGTQWLDNQAVDRDRANLARMTDSECAQAGPGDVVLLKGTLWQENRDLGAIHRSPEIGAGACPRTLVTLDPLWDA